MHTLEPYLASHPFLKDLKKEYLELLVGCASNVRFEPGDYVFREGKEANHFYLIRQGNVSLELFVPGKGAITIRTVDEGDVLGWSWLVPPYHWHFDARALDTTLAIALDGKCLRTKCEHDHDLGYELLKRFVQVIEESLQATRFQLLDIYKQP